MHMYKILEKGFLSPFRSISSNGILVQYKGVSNNVTKVLSAKIDTIYKKNHGIFPTLFLKVY